MNRLSNFNCFGLVIHGLNRLEIAKKIDEYDEQEKRLWIVTANPEILLEAKRDAGYWQALHGADFRTVDGFGLQMAGWLNDASPARLSGVELAEMIFARADKKKQKVALLGGQEGAADKSAWLMRSKFPNLKISAFQGGQVDDNGMGDHAAETALHNLQSEAPEVLFVAYGHPKQEKWIAKNLNNLPSLKIIMGIGGTFDFWSGKIKRAPSFLQKLGLEWLWRLYQEPHRWRRIINAVLIFPLVIVKEYLGKDSRF